MVNGDNRNVVRLSPRLLKTVINVIMVVKPAQFSAPHFAQGIVICRELYAATEKDAMSDNIPNTLSAGQAEHDPNFMLSLARGLEVITPSPPAPAADHSQLSQKTQISRAAVRRCLYTLAALGMVHSPDGRSYELLPGCWPRLSGRHAAGQGGADGAG